MTSACLEHKTWIALAESMMEKSHFSMLHMQKLAIFGLQTTRYIIDRLVSYKKYFNLEIDRYLSLGPSWMAISDYLGGYLLTKTHHLLHIIHFFTKTHHFCCILPIFFT